MRSELVSRAVEALRARGATVSFAESCTGGMLSSMVTSVAGVSDVYMGSIVAYSNEVKESVLGVERRLLQSSGAVSSPVARAMARGVRDLIGTTWSVSITGIAGPGGGSVERPVGTVFVAIAGPGVDRAVEQHFTGGRHVIQQASADYALQLLIEEVGEMQALN
jgi:PncC family amidohydrolase